LILCVIITCLVLYETASKPQGISLDKDVAWRVETDTPLIITPILIDDNLIIRTHDEIISLDNSSGKIYWETQSNAYSKLIDDYAIPRQLTGNSQYLIVGEASNSIGVYSTETGSSWWKFATDIDFINNIQIIDNIMLIARHDHDLAAYDLDSKRKVWDTTVPGPTNLSIAANTNVVVLAAGQLLQVYDLQSGKLLEAVSYPDAILGEVILDGTTLFLVYNPEEGEGLSVDSLQLDSLEKNWTYHEDLSVQSYLHVIDRQLYLYDKALVSLDKSTGALLWKEDTQVFYSKPVAYSDDLYFISIGSGLDKNLCSVKVTSGKLVECTTVGKARLFGSANDIVASLVVDSMLIVSNDTEVVAYQLAE
jgi:outer membrane protein assembly factor BamB